MSELGMNDNPAANIDPVNADPEGAALPPASPGARLAAYRQERGWTVEQVASQLNLAPRQIIAIEADDYPSLPGMPIVRGFIRAYAKLLKVDAAPLLATLGGETVLAQEPMAARKTLSTPFAEKRLPSLTDRPSLSSKWVIGGLLMVLVGVAVWATQQSAKMSGLQKSASNQVKDGLAYLSGSEQAAEKPVPAKAEEAASAAALPPAPTGLPVQQPAPAPVTVAASGEAQVKPVAPAVVAPVSQDNLTLVAREDSWIEVRRVSNNKSMLSRILRSGETETVEITEPVSLVIGNAAAVDATLRGDPLELKAGRANVARINLK